MIRTAIVFLAVLVAAGPARAQTGGHIAIYSDNPGYSNCNLNETLFVTNSVYIVHEQASEANTAQFMVAVDWPGVVVAGASFANNLHLGELLSGVVITYVGCESLPYLLARLDFIPMAETPACGGSARIVADPSLLSGRIEVVDCSTRVLTATGGLLTVNGNDDCPCAGDVEASSWGRMKSLYQ